MTNKLFFILGTLLIAWMIGMAGYFLGQNGEKPKNLPPDASGGSVACTMEARICPDGTAVGRTGPDCEFEPCPVNLPEMAE